MSHLLSIFTKSENSFGGEEPGEKVLLLVRRHPFFIIIRSIFFIVLFFLPIGLGVWFFPQLQSRGLIEYFLFLSGLWHLFVWSVMFYALTMYTLDVWIVTDRRIIDSIQHGFWSRTISELHLSRIQDISVETCGIIQTLFKFGDLQVQTAGAEEKFKFIQIPHPERVKDEIMKAVSAYQSHHL